MFVKLEKYFRGSVKIKVEGAFFQRFLNLCNKQDLLLWDIKRTLSGCELWLYASDYKKIRPLVKKTGCRVTILQKKGVPFERHRYRKRKLFFGGMLFSVISIYILSLFIWNIHFEGNVSQSSGELLKYLETIGITRGVSKREISCEDIESKLRITYPNLLWVSAEIKGTRILIQVKENTDPDIVTEVKKEVNSAMSLVAMKSGVVESIVVRKGTPKVMKGDVVAVGQTLVEGYYDIKNDAGEVIRYEPVCADADILILTEEAYHDQFAVKYRKKEYTQKKRMGISFGMGEKTIAFQPKKPYFYYDTICRNYEFRISEDFYLPFRMSLCWYLEYVPKVQQYDKIQLQKIAKKRFLKKYENILQKGVQIIEKNVRIDTNGKFCLVTGMLKLLVSETTKVPANLPDIGHNASLEGE